jgi:signal transduction histidine kinase
VQIGLIENSVFIILLEILIAFLCIVAFGLYRFSKGLTYRLWSIAWILFSVSVTIGLLTTGEGLVMTDAFATAGMLVAALLLVDGARSTKRQGIDVLIYPTVYITGFAIVPFGILLNIYYGIVFTPITTFTTYACWLSAKKFRENARTRDFDYWTLVIGLVLWGFFMLLFSVNLFIDVLALQLILTTTALIMTGAGMLNVFIRETTENLKIQYAITQLISGILNHDIRNYVGTLQEAIEQMQTSSTDQKFWLDLSSEAISSMARFIADMRYISAGISRFEADKSPIAIYELLNDVKTRVLREYNLSEEAILIEVDDDVFVLTNSIVNEMFWNIIDNAFKHGCKNLRIQETSLIGNQVTLEIIDDAGGLPTTVIDFLNNSEALSSSAAPGMGLGIILITGLSVLCGVKMNVKNISLADQSSGCIFTLDFKRETPIEIT